MSQGKMAATPPPAKKPKPQTFDEAFETVEDSHDESKDDGDENENEKPKRPLGNLGNAVDDDDDTVVPEWATLPSDRKGRAFSFPPDQPDICFMRFKAQWTRQPSAGERWCLLWPLTDNEEKVASKRVTDPRRSVAEMSKQMLRVVDGELVDWGKGNVDKFWNEIGPKCRLQIQNFYMKTHSLSVDEQLDFFEHCVHVVSAKVG